MQAHTHANTHAYRHTHTNTHTHTYRHTCTRTHTHVHSHTYIHTYAQTNIHTHTHKHKHTRTHVHTHTYIVALHNGGRGLDLRRLCNTLQHAATRCNTLHHIAIHCNTLQRITLQHNVTHYTTLQHPATPCNTLQHPATYCNTLQHTATHCNTLQHTVALHNRGCGGYMRGLFQKRRRGSKPFWKLPLFLFRNWWEVSVEFCFYIQASSVGFSSYTLNCVDTSSVFWRSLVVYSTRALLLFYNSWRDECMSVTLRIWLCDLTNHTRDVTCPHAFVCVTWQFSRVNWLVCFIYMRGISRVNVWAWLFCTRVPWHFTCATWLQHIIYIGLFTC